MRISLVIAFLGCGLVAACSSAPPPQAAAPAGPPPKPFLDGVVMGDAGRSLTDQDRQTAGEAQYAAIETGQRKSWRGKGGTYGFIEPGTQSGSCRDYSHTIYIDGRPKTGKGSACLEANGNWKYRS